MKKEIFDAYAEAIAKQFHLTLDELFTKEKKGKYCFITYVKKGQ